MKTQSNLSIDPLKRAFESLKQATQTAPKSELERDGVIQRFEYTFELSWKSIRALLQTLGKINVSTSPKSLLRDALAEGLISDIDIWFRFLAARNESSHTYHSLTVEEVHQEAIRFVPYAE